MTRPARVPSAIPRLLRSSRVWAALAAQIALLLLLSPFAQMALAASAAPPPITLAGTVPSQIAHAQLIGHNSPTAQIGIELVLTQKHQAQILTLLQALTNPKSQMYHHWLKTGQYATMFAPSASDVTAAKNFLTHAGFHLLNASPSPLFILATGTSSQAEAAFHTTINMYRLADGTLVYSNATNVSIPANLGGIVQDVLGLNNVPLEQPLLSSSADQSASSPAAVAPHYGGGPDGTGLTPSQIQGIYDAGPVYSGLNDQGQGETLALYELSGYKRSDITAYEKQFSLPNVSITDKFTSFFLFRLFYSHSGADEVELDIEMALALAPKLKSIIVYEARNGGSDILNNYAQIANDNTADVVSTSWGSCESSIISGGKSSFAVAENDVFLQMALQGQSMFAAAGDDGAFDCGGSSTSLQVDDPASQPFVTAVGGTSFQNTFDPGANQNPTYPSGQEHVWNNNCPASCNSAPTSGGGGGVSTLWSAYYQAGPGVNEPGFSTSGASCNKAPGVACREVPDVSLNADSASGYSIYCTDGGNNLCRAAAKQATNPGWVKVGGTSAAAPLWAAITALIDNAVGAREGFMNPYVYAILNAPSYSTAFHDIVSTAGYTSNGNYPTGTAYDMATGAGSIDIDKFLLAAISFSPHGSVWITGHDADFHCGVTFEQCNYFRVALNFAMHGSTLPVLSLDHQGAGLGPEVAEAAANAYGASAPTIITVDPRSGFASLPLVDANGHPLYSAIVIASDTTCGGCDNNDSLGVTPDSDAINARAFDILRFYLAGGGILGLAGAMNTSVFYNFLPVPVNPSPVSPPFMFTHYGLSLGLIEGTGSGSDDNCCVTHNSFVDPTQSGSPYQIAEKDAAGLPETLIDPYV